MVYKSIAPTVGRRRHGSQVLIPNRWTCEPRRIPIRKSFHQEKTLPRTTHAFLHTFVFVTSCIIVVSLADGAFPTVIGIVNANAINLAIGSRYIGLAQSFFYNQ